MSSSVTLEDLREELDKKTYNRDTSDAAFIPYDRIQEVWAGDRLARFLKNHTDESFTAEEIDVAQSSLLRMISLLIDIHWDGWSRFRQIFFLHPKAIAERRDHNIKSLDDETLKHESFLGNTSFPRKFLTHKWIYIPITLDGYSLQPHDKGTRLPLVRDDNWLRNGGFGEVTKEMIPPNHIVLKHLSEHLGLSDQANSAELMVARKRFPRGRYEVEINRLKFIQSSSSSHNRIVYPLAIVIVDHDLNIITPCATMDLEDFLAEGYKSMHPTKCLLRDLLDESCELAAALEFLHRGLQAKCDWLELQHQALCHADFKPRNILVFERDGSSTGIWRITDFGVSRVARRSISREARYESGLSTAQPSIPAPAGGIYQAPDAHAGRRSDVWSFGCILVRIIALGLKHGCQSPVNALRARAADLPPVPDRFYEEDPLALNQSVEKWIRNLPDQYRDSYNLQFLNEIRDLLLSMLEINFSNRPYADVVHSRLHRLRKMPMEPTPAFLSLPLASSTTAILPATPTRSTTSTPLTSPNTSRTSQESTPTTGTLDLSRDPFEIDFLVEKIKSASVDVVEQFLRRRPDLDIEQLCEGNRPLIHAIESGSAALIYVLWNHKRNLDVTSRSSQQETPLNLAVLTGDFDKVKIIIDILPEHHLEACLNEFSQAGKTPLMEAASNGHVAMVSELLKRGAIPTICDDSGLNCLHYAVDNIESREDLLKAFEGFMVFDHSPPGIRGYETPMMRHISHGIDGAYGALEIDPLWVKKFNVLLNGKADVDRSYPIKSPLQLAVAQNNAQIAEVLLKAGAFLPHAEKGKTKEMQRLIKRMRK